MRSTPKRGVFFQTKTRTLWVSNSGTQEWDTELLCALWRHYTGQWRIFGNSIMAAKWSIGRYRDDFQKKLLKEVSALLNMRQGLGYIFSREQLVENTST